MSEIHDMNLQDKVTKVYAHVEENGGLATNWQDQHTRPLDLKFIRPLNAVPFTTLASAITAGEYTISVTSITTILATLAVGDGVVCVNPDGTFNVAEITIIAGAGPYTLTLDRQLDTTMVVPGTSVIYTTNNLASANGSLASPVIYQIAGVGAAVNLDIDVTRVMGNIQDGTATMNDGLFGSNVALDNGCVLRKITDAGVVTNYWNVKTNGDIALICFDLNYEATGPQTSEFSMRFRNTYAGVGKHGVTIRLEPGDTLQLLIQDVMLNEIFNMMAQGHLVSEIH